MNELYGTPLYPTKLNPHGERTGYYDLSAMPFMPGDQFIEAGGSSHGQRHLIVIHDGLIYRDALVLQGEIQYRLRWPTTCPRWQREAAV